MAINRYTQPIKSQYIPTTPNPQLMAMMMQKRSADEARAQQERASFESSILGLKAYGEEDEEILKSKEQEYTGRMSDIYDQYKGDPNAQLHAMNVLNRDYKKDLLSGDLYDINYRYGKAMEGVKDANDRYASGDLNIWERNSQIENAASGFKVRTSKNMMKNALALVEETNWAHKDYKNIDDALASEMQAFVQDNKEALSYLPEDEFARTLKSFETHFRSKYNNDMSAAGIGTGNSGQVKFMHGEVLDVNINNEDIQHIQNNPIFSDFINIGLLTTPQTGLSEAALRAQVTAIKKGMDLVKEKYPALHSVVDKNLTKELGRKPTKKETRKALAEELTRMQSRSNNVVSFNSATTKENLMATLADEGKVKALDKDGDEQEFSLVGEDKTYSSDVLEVIPFKGTIKVQNNGVDMYITSETEGVTPKAKAILETGNNIYKEMYDFSNKGITFIGTNRASGKPLVIPEGEFEDFSEEKLKSIISMGETDHNGNQYMYYLDPIEGTTEKALVKVTLDENGVIGSTAMSTGEFGEDVGKIISGIYQFKNK